MGLLIFFLSFCSQNTIFALSFWISEIIIVLCILYRICMISKVESESLASSFKCFGCETMHMVCTSMYTMFLTCLHHYFSFSSICATVLESQCFSSPGAANLLKCISLLLSVFLFLLNKSAHIPVFEFTFSFSKIKKVFIICVHFDLLLSFSRKLAS